ncbi:MAG: hypothetical protein EP298_10470 [Gammaproteobacteria bacterium]|nr:MAG: hypothetical protein EP298_10470 [Gammaproteobacteria bacterium]UTW42196.1 hypothetical protein KFE69_11990 [bacterium SCSIO 12844]
MNNQVVDPELKLKKKFLKKFKLSNPTMILLALIILLLVIILVQQFSDSSKTKELHNQINKIASSIKTNHQTQNQILSNINKQTKAITSIDNNYNQVNQMINSAVKNQSLIQSKLSQQFEQTNKAISNNAQSLAQILKLLNMKLGQLSDQNSSLHSILNTPQGFKRTDQYTISSIAPYGVIIQDKQGNFLIARLNKQLSVGVITAITEHYIIAGNYVITNESSKMHNSVSIIKKMTP